MTFWCSHCEDYILNIEGPYYGADLFITFVVRCHDQKEQVRISGFDLALGRTFFEAFKAGTQLSFPFMK